MRLRVTVLGVLLSLLVPAMASAATIQTLTPGVNNLFTRALPGETDQILGNGFVASDGVLSFGLSNILGGLQDQGNKLTLQFGWFCEFGNCDGTLFESVLFNNGPGGPFFIETSGSLPVVDGAGIELDLDFAIMGNELLFETYFTDAFGGTPSVNLGWSVTGQINGLELDSGGGSGPPSPVPLPAAGWLLLAGVGGLMALSRRRRSVAA